MQLASKVITTQTLPAFDNTPHGTHTSHPSSHARSCQSVRTRLWTLQVCKEKFCASVEAHSSSVAEHTNGMVRLCDSSTVSHLDGRFGVVEKLRDSNRMSSANCTCDCQRHHRWCVRPLRAETVVALHVPMFRAPSEKFVRSLDNRRNPKCLDSQGRTPMRIENSCSAWLSVCSTTYRLGAKKSTEISARRVVWI